MNRFKNQQRVRVRAGRYAGHMGLVIDYDQTTSLYTVNVSPTGTWLHFTESDLQDFTENNGD